MSKHKQPALPWKLAKLQEDIGKLNKHLSPYRTPLFVEMNEFKKLLRIVEKTIAALQNDVE